MVVWVFAGGGEAELKGLINFFRENFGRLEFRRYLPMKKKKAPSLPKRWKTGKGKPKTQSGFGHTGKSLAGQIEEVLPFALRSGNCDLILVLDDLDCRNIDAQRAMFSDTIAGINDAEHIDRHVAFAVPEIESWLIADWDNTFAKHTDFREFHEGLRHLLSRRHVPFDDPESFSEFDDKNGGCKEKLSRVIIDSVHSESLRLGKSLTRFKKGGHTPDLLLKADPKVVADKCPVFREMYNYLMGFPSPG